MSPRKNLFELSSQEKSRVVEHNKKSHAFGLPSNLHIEDWKDTLVDFGYRCLFTGTYEISLEHFIPQSIGHGGTMRGNVYPLSKSLNSSKGDTNPFIWAHNNRHHIEYDKFLQIVEYLAEQLSLSPEEFKDYVFWCFANPRTDFDIKRDQLKGYRTSLQLWKAQRKKEEQTARVLSYFASLVNIEEANLFVSFADWCLQHHHPIHQNSFPLYIQSLYQK